MKTKHTPAPWTAAGPGILDTPHRDKRIMVLHPDGIRLIADTGQGYIDPKGNAIPDDERRANARLIAAAPELLDAANDLLCQWDAPDLSDDTPIKEKFDALRAALDKATR